MSTGKLDQSLDEILKTRRQSNRRGRGRRAAAGGRPNTTEAPVGGVQKTQKPAKGGKNVPTGPAGGSGESKIQVSNLPSDIDEQQIKVSTCSKSPRNNGTEYFAKTIGPIKRVFLTYGPNGQSRGICTVVFGKPGAAAEAAKELDGVKVDHRPLRVEVLVSARDAPAPPPAKSLADRVSGPKQAKAQPKPATNTKPAGGRGRGNKRGRGGRNARGPKKTVDELDADMVDYFADGTGAGNNDGDAMVTNGGAVQAPTSGDTGMEDEML
ncbi:hypothetical protein K469DRAFT_562658 [Zopfia rhizophila CBS 207.26]|uniref:RRM domain-containing protein n=1 Tax=Zopfia rhizophila CBS 207.26 TaxID=1314779 RepID=A0A6A6ECU9_9PEZI|nr:hypothetical protein K469DRAFT_562658 [Zopfia rhizophila CBS 207.26]